MKRVYKWLGGRKATFTWIVLAAGVALAAAGRLTPTFVTLGLGLVAGYGIVNVTQKAVTKDEDPKQD